MDIEKLEKKAWSPTSVDKNMKIMMIHRTLFFFFFQLATTMNDEWVCSQRAEGQQLKSRTSKQIIPNEYIFTTDSILVQTIKITVDKPIISYDVLS